MLGIVIVTHNSEEVIGRCLHACAVVPDATVLVIDNASADGTADQVRRRPAVRLIANRDNIGFAAAVNQGIEQLGTSHVLVLNPDVVLCGPVAGLLDACNGPVGAATGRLVDSRGQARDDFHLRTLPTPWTLAFEALAVNRFWPGNPVNRRYRGAHSGDRVEQPSGAFLLIAREAWRAAGGFDESFAPVWFEDVDFCKRLRDLGYGIAYVSQVAAEHAGGHSVRGLSWEERQTYWYVNLLKYVSKHFPARGRLVASLGVTLACFPRAAIEAVRARSVTPLAVYSRVIWAAAKCLSNGGASSHERAARMSAVSGGGAGTAAG
ncbi:MAG: glycosyltransferase family 2 protein [Acidobacteria bacterium]|nr:glycosyltransferase family 2 protein [Acidobacteriota bacterium]